MNDSAGPTGARILITGGAGFLGSLLANRLLEEGSIELDGARPRAIGSLTVVDMVPPRLAVSGDDRISVVTGRLDDVVDALPDADVIFHLAGVVSGAAEADFDLGMHTNVDGTRLILERARKQEVPPTLVFASSLAVYGTDPALEPLGVVSDSTMPTPQSSYGIQKFIGEQLVADYTRKRFVNGRTVRLMTVAVRPGRPNAAASSFLSGIIREPLAGVRATCPVDPDLPVALSSPRRTIDGLLRAAAVSKAEWGSNTAMNLPALTITPREMAAALNAATGQQTSDLINWKPDPAIDSIVSSWPAVFVADRAARLGLVPEDTFEDIVRQFMDDDAPVPAEAPVEADPIPTEHRG